MSLVYIFFKWVPALNLCYEEEIDLRLYLICKCRQTRTFWTRKMTKKLLKLSHTSANLSNLAKSSFRVFTSSGAGHVDDIAVKPTISANNMLIIEWNQTSIINQNLTLMFHFIQIIKYRLCQYLIIFIFMLSTSGKTRYQYLSSIA